MACQRHKEKIVYVLLSHNDGSFNDHSSQLTAPLLEYLSITPFNAMFVVLGVNDGVNLKLFHSNWIHTMFKKKVSFKVIILFKLSNVKTNH